MRCVCWMGTALLLFAGCCSAQSIASQKNARSTAKSLVVTDMITIASEPATNTITPLGCDSEGNFYLMTEVDAESGIHKFNSKGQQVTLFRANSAVDGKMAILFHEPQTKDELIKVVDLEGRELATYRITADNGRSALGPAFICYSEDPERFTFVTTTDDRLAFKIAEPR
jgi:hypothetical protein